MKVNELRIGNFVNRLGEPTLITAIEKGTNTDYVSTTKSGAITINQISPILLNRELMLKCKGVKLGAFDDDFYLYDFRFRFIQKNLDYINEEGFCVLQMLYLHQLQNLLFALVGEELEIEL